MTVGEGERLRAVEPVHWGSHLVRAPGLAYTEVAGIPCLVRASDGVVQTLTPTWAAIWARLDGRRVTDALNVDVQALDPIDARNLIEVLRRLKGRGAICDVDPSDSPRPAEDLRSPTGSARTVKLVLRGSTDRHHRSTGLTVDAAAAGRASVILADGGGSVTIAIARRLRKRPVDHIAVVDSTATGAASGAASGTVECFAAIVRAVDDRGALVTPGLVDLLAGLAERAAEPGSLRR
jgi:hypothetical protein